MKKLLLLMLCLGIGPPALLAQLPASPFSGTITASGCITVPTGNKGTVTFQVSGSWSGTIQPEGKIDGNAAFNVQVNPFQSATPQSTITANGIYTLNVPGLDALLLCGATVTSTATVKGNAVQIVAKSTSGGGAGSVTSVGLTVNGTSPSGIFAVTNSPVTSTGNLDLDIAGSSGGVPYFSNGTTLTSSAVLTANSPVLGGGAGVAPKTATFLTTNGTSELDIGVIAGGNGVLGLKGNTSGTATCTAPAVAGTSTNPVTCSNVFLAPVGSATTPSYGDSASTQTGLFFVGDANLLTSQGNPVFLVQDSQHTVRIGSNMSYGWSSATSAVGAVNDTNLSRDSAGVVDIGTGAAGNKGGSLNLTNLTATGTVTAGTLVIPSDGVHAGGDTVVCNTANPVGFPFSNSFTLIGCNSASITAFGWQAPTAESATSAIVRVGAAASHVNLLGYGANCSAAGSAANPSLVACGAATEGAFSCATNASTGTCVISTTAVTANSNILVQPNSSYGTRLSVTCNTTADTGLVAPRVSSITAATSFTINLGTFTTNPECFDFFIGGF